MDKPLTLERVSALLGLEPLLHRSPHALSGGQQQRVAIGRALLVQPRLLLLDEPLAGLDLESRAEILPCLEALHRELSLPVLYVSHVPMEVQRLADYLVLLEQGAVIASGEINDVLTRPGLALSRADEAAALLDATVQRHDSPFHLTELQTPGGSIYVPAQDLEVGAPLRLRILARDVSIALERIEDTSISNVLEAEIASINEDRDAANRLLQLDVGGTLILSRVTGRSVERLRLRPGMRVFAQVKSVALA
jgi:molybdate transport system ATP-binding protein